MGAVAVKKKKPVAAIRSPGLRFFVKSLNPLKSDLIRGIAVDLGAEHVVLKNTGHHISILHMPLSG
jgi:hypothetical protein